MNECMDYTFRPTTTAAGWQLARVANLRRLIINSQAGKYASSHCTSVRVVDDSQHGAARRTEVRIRRPSSLCRRALKQHMIFVAKGAHIAIQAKADVGHLGDTAYRNPAVPCVGG